MLSINRVLSYYEHRSTQSLVVGDTSCHQTALQRATKPLLRDIFCVNI